MSKLCPLFRPGDGARSILSEVKDMAQNKTMAIKHKKARVEAMKECNEIQLRGVMGDYQRGKVTETANGLGMYKAHAQFVASGNRCSVKKFVKPVIPSRKEA